MALFGGLPAPEARVRRMLTDNEVQEARLAEELAGLPDDEDEEQGGLDLEALPPVEEPQLKRRRRETNEEDQGAHSAEPDGAQTAPAASGQPPAQIQSPTEQPTAPASTPAQAQQGQGATPPSGADDQVYAALRRLASHISNPAKFAKASPLLRQLLDSGTLGPQHRMLAFDAVRAAFSLAPGRQKHLVDPMNRREVLKLMAAVEALASGGFFSPAEATQVEEVYRLLAVTCNELHTDDSFVFAKALAKVREAVDRLPPRYDMGDDEALLAAAANKADPEEAAAYEHVLNDRPGRVQPLQPTPAAPPAARPAEEEDPFGLGALMGPSAGEAATEHQDPRQEPRAGQEQGSAWGPLELLAARRRAVLIAVQHACTYHKHAWAQTGIELLVEHCWKNKASFSPAQTKELDELWAWVRKAHAVRKAGPSAKEVNRDSTSFERARAEWSRATVSTRGKIGGGGDAKSTSWLG